MAQAMHCVRPVCVQLREEDARPRHLLYKYEAMTFEDMQIFSVTDASHANDYDTSSNGGKLMQAAWKPKPEREVFTSRFPLPTGNRRRDHLHRFLPLQPDPSSVQ